jgi:hypothetical protein
MPKLPGVLANIFKVVLVKLQLLIICIATPIDLSITFGQRQVFSELQ